MDGVGVADAVGLTYVLTVEVVTSTTDTLASSLFSALLSVV